MKIVFRAGNIVEAEIVKGMLISNGIQAHVSGYYLQGGIGEVGVLDLAKVHVADDDYDKAKLLIMEYEGNRSEGSQVSHGTGYEESSRTHKAVITIVIVIVVSILGYWLGV